MSGLEDRDSSVHSHCLGKRSPHCHGSLGQKEDPQKGQRLGSWNLHALLLFKVAGCPRHQPSEECSSLDGLARMQKIICELEGKGAGRRVPWGPSLQTMLAPRTSQSD